MNTRTSVSTEQRSETELLNFLLGYCVENEFPVALWRLPNNTRHYLIISRQYSTLDNDAALEETTPGFLFAPFDNQRGRLFLPGDFMFSFKNGKLSAPETSIETASDAWLTEKLRSSKPSAFCIKAEPKSAPEYNGDFLQLIADSISEIERGTFEKIVPSRMKVIDLPPHFDVTVSFQKLCNTYPNALVSFVSIPGIGNWIGATPEVLVSLEDKSIFRTVALAGTQPYHPGTNLRAVAWTQKEIEEQALVERYVISCFKKIRLREYEEHGPKTVVAGNLMHLKSDFTVDINATNFPQLATVMLKLLHPTSAVCGMPLEPSLEFLKKFEGYDREFYAGYLGPVNVNNDINIFVNLRCMKLLEKQAILYAGAGVTMDSIAEKEFEETEIKFNTLLNVIF